MHQPRVLDGGQSGLLPSSVPLGVAMNPCARSETSESPDGSELVSANYLGAAWESFVEP